MSIYCPFCGEKLVDDAKFCKNCGKDVSNYKKHDTESTNNYSYQPPVVEKSHTLATVLGFICAIFIPLFGVIFGIYLYTRKDSADAKKFGTIIIVLAVAIWILSFITAMIWY